MHLWADELCLHTSMSVCNYASLFVCLADLHSDCNYVRSICVFERAANAMAIVTM
jgi:hypothetical protein